MNILLTNDDGIYAKGLRTLYDRLKKDGHNVGISAPYTNQSAKSQSINIKADYTVHQDSKYEFGVEGTPADSVLFMLFSGNFNSFNPDVIISGINLGYNVSSDILYSGTCGAASEAAMNGYKSIAVSASSEDDSSLEKAAEFVAKNIEELVKHVEKYTYMSINVPANSDSVAWEPCRLTYFAHCNKIVEGESVEKQITIYHNVIFDERDYKDVVKEDRKEEADLKSDCEVVGNGKISISLVSVVPRTFSSKLVGMKLR